VIKKENVKGLINELVPPFADGPTSFAMGLEVGTLLAEKRPDVSADLMEMYRNGDYFAPGDTLIEDISDVLKGLGVA